MHFSANTYFKVITCNIYLKVISEIFIFACLLFHYFIYKLVIHLLLVTCILGKEDLHFLLDPKQFCTMCQEHTLKSIYISKKRSCICFTELDPFSTVSGICQMTKNTF